MEDRPSSLGYDVYYYCAECRDCFNESVTYHNEGGRVWTEVEIPDFTYETSEEGPLKSYYDDTALMLFTLRSPENDGVSHFNVSGISVNSGEIYGPGDGAYILAGREPTLEFPQAHLNPYADDFLTGRVEFKIPYKYLKENGFHAVIDYEHMERGYQDWTVDKQTGRLVRFCLPKKIEKIMRFEGEGYGKTVAGELDNTRHMRGGPLDFDGVDVGYLTGDVRLYHDGVEEILSKEQQGFRGMGSHVTWYQPWELLTVEASDRTVAEIEKDFFPQQGNVILVYSTEMINHSFMNSTPAFLKLDALNKSLMYDNYGVYGVDFRWSGNSQRGSNAWFTENAESLRERIGGVVRANGLDENETFVLIFGGPEIVPFAAVDDPMGDIMLMTDAYAADTDGDILTPELGVGRLPSFKPLFENADSPLFISLVRTTVLYHLQYRRNHSIDISTFSNEEFAAKTRSYLPREDPFNVEIASFRDGQLDYIRTGILYHDYHQLIAMFHGNWRNKEFFYDNRSGIISQVFQERTMSSIPASQLFQEGRTLPEDSMMFVSNCYGGYTLRSTNESIPAVFFANGGTAYVGSSGIVTVGVYRDLYWDVFAKNFISEVYSGKRVGEAYVKGRKELLEYRKEDLLLSAGDEMDRAVAYILSTDPEFKRRDEKTSLEVTVYGDPTFKYG